METGHSAATGVWGFSGEGKTDPEKAAGSAVLLAVADTFKAEDALWRASALSRVFGAELQVVRVEENAPSRAFPGEAKSPDDSFYALRWERTLALRTWRWCNRRLVSPIRPIQVSARAGAYAGVVADAAREMRPVMVIVSALEVRGGVDAAQIAVDSGVPVLVARPACQGDVVMAATDLVATHAAVLKAGTALASRLGSGVVFFHNVAPGSPSPGEVDHRRSLLEKAAAESGERVEVVLAHGRETIDATIDIASRAAADVVVVGVCDWGTLDAGTAGKSTAAGVVERSGTSVLVVPLGE